MSDIEKIVIEAIRNKEIVKVEYNRKQGGVSIREMEPFDISPGKKTPSGPMKFWGWCLFHDSIEGKHMSGIISVKKTGKKFDPSIREKNFGQTNYRISIKKIKKV